MRARARSRGTARAAVSGLAALALLGPLAVAPSAAAAPAAPRTAPAVAAPKLAWSGCPEDVGYTPEELGGRFDCAVATVPLDHDDPRGPTIDLALKRRKADAPKQRIGSLFVNPGGPGGSGVDFVGVAGFLYAPEVLARFDVIGFDPRGIARSQPLVCFDSYEDAYEWYRVLPTFPVTPQEERQTSAAYAAYASRCAKRAPAVLSHMSTGDVARDLDLLRAAVGDSRLSYAGYSYGSQLGTTYANLFPARVRALVLDGVLDPIAWTTGVPQPTTPDDLARRSSLPVSTRLRSGEGASASLRQFFDRCRTAGPKRCALANGDPKARFDRLAVRVLAQSVEIPMGGGYFQRVGYAELSSLAMSALYDPQTWPEFAEFVAEVERFGGNVRAGQAYRRLTAALRTTGATEEEPGEQTVEGLDGVLCSDSDNPRNVQAWSAASLEADLRAPYFGRAWTWASAACATWPAPAVEDRYAGPWNARTAAPVLVVGNRYDPATPYSGARAVAGLLPSSRLLTLEGWGHVAAGQSTCIDAHVTAYLLRGALPRAGSACRPDLQPFTPPEQVAALRVKHRTERGRAAARQEILRQLPPVR